MSNAELAKRQIANHGRDRYPTREAQMLKLMEEVGELSKEVNKAPKFTDSPMTSPALIRVQNEAADVALALYNLAAKFGFDLDTAIECKVDSDTRKF